MSEKLIEELEAETLAALNEAPGTTTKEDLMDINYIRQSTGSLAELEKIEIEKKKADIEQCKIDLEKKQLETQVEIEKIKASANVKVANRGLIANILKVGAFVLLAGVDLVNCYIDDGRTPKLFGMIHNGLSK